MVGILCFMKHLLSIASSHLWDRYSLVLHQNIISSSDFVVFSNATTLLYSSTRKGYTMEVSPSVAGGSTLRFDVDGMLPLLLTRSWCATWFALDVVGSFDSFLIVFHALRLLCAILVDVITPISSSSPPLFCRTVYFQILNCIYIYRPRSMLKPPWFLRLCYDMCAKCMEEEKLRKRRICDRSRLSSDLTLSYFFVLVSHVLFQNSVNCC